MSALLKTAKDAITTVQARPHNDVFSPALSAVSLSGQEKYDLKLPFGLNIYSTCYSQEIGNRGSSASHTLPSALVTWCITWKKNPRNSIYDNVTRAP